MRRMIFSLAGIVDESYSIIDQVWFDKNYQEAIKTLRINGYEEYTESPAHRNFRYDARIVKLNGK